MGKNYFNEEEVKAKILEYRKTKNEFLINDIYIQLEALVKGVIFANNFLKYAIELEELVSEGMVAVSSAINSFDENYLNSKNKNSLFSYLSLAVKYSLMAFTKKYKDKVVKVPINEELVDEKYSSNFIVNIIKLDEINKIIVKNEEEKQIKEELVAFLVNYEYLENITEKQIILYLQKVKSIKRSKTELFLKKNNVKAILF
jgi:DNA-directed RNA polymerase sigma subunit (sigma70/sigma32)